MKQKIKNIKQKTTALFWFLIHKNYYLLSYNRRCGKALDHIIWF